MNISNMCQTFLTLTQLGGKQDSHRIFLSILSGSALVDTPDNIDGRESQQQDRLNGQQVADTAKDTQLAKVGNPTPVKDGTPSKDNDSEPISISTPREHAVRLSDPRASDSRSQPPESPQDPLHERHREDAAEHAQTPQNPSSASATIHSAAAAERPAAVLGGGDAPAATPPAEPLSARTGDGGGGDTPRRFSRANSPREPPGSARGYSRAGSPLREQPGSARGGGGAVLTETEAVISIYHGADNRRAQPPPPHSPQVRVTPLQSRRAHAAPSS
jgi:hypothetical protein